MKFQQFVMSSDQLMIIDGQPTHQVIVNQTPVVYEQQDISGIVAVPQQQPQTVFYMDNTVNIPTEGSQVEMELPPIVLNHRLGSQISLVQRPPKTTMTHQQMNLMQQVQRVSSPKMLRPQVNSSQLQNIQHVNQEQHQQFMRSNIQQKQQEGVAETPSVTIERTSQIRQINSQNQFQRVLEPSQSPVIPQKVSSVQYQAKNLVMDQSIEFERQEGISLNDGKVISIGEYKEMILKQQQQRLNINPEISFKKAKSPNVNTMRGRAKVPMGTQNRPSPKQLMKPQEACQIEIDDQARFLDQHQQITQTCFDNPPSQQALTALPSSDRNRQNRPPSQFLQDQNQQLIQKVAQTQKPQLPPQQPRQNNHNYLIQPPKHNVNKPIQHCPLPSCVPSSQIKKIIESTPVNEEYSDSIRMLVMLANGEQRLITFTLPNQACTIQEILEQVGVPLQPDTVVDVSEANSNGINYMVTVGFLQSSCQNEETPENISAIDPQLQLHSSTPLLNTSEQSPEPLRELTPEPIKEEQPKYIEGKMAVCGYCGILSDDFNKCMRCKTKLPENVKSIAAISAMKKGENRSGPTKREQQSTNTNGTKDLVKKKSSGRGRNNEHETVILTLSSDEEQEENQETNSKPINESLLHKLGSAITLSPIKKEPSLSDIQKTVGYIEGDKSKTNPENFKDVSLQCRTVRIGSYRTIPRDNVLIDSNSISVKVSSITNPKETVTIKIDKNDVVKVLISFHKQLPVLFYYLRPHMGNAVREILGMKDTDSTFYDPLSEHEPQKRITLLPEQITEETKNILCQIYRPSNMINMLEELTVKEANDILLKTCPKELTLANLQPSCGSSIFEVKPLFTYPPEGRGRISINTEDYMCLGSDQFLNDVIIDFYLKYLVHNLSKEEQERVHVFSTFFYKRLTTKPVKASRKSQPTELDPSLTPAEKRHARVKTWTKNVDLFKKDYVVVPINENCHWFLAIICYPGLEGCMTMDGHPIKIDIAPKKRKETQTKTTIGNVTITAVKREETPCEDLESDKDEAEGDESELESDDADETQTVTSHCNRPPIKHPCILIFDSLAGTGRSRVVATLRDYLSCEYRTKYNRERSFNKDTIKGACPKVPQQTNFTDCGLYLLQYVEHFFMEPIKDYYIPINSLKTWFDEITVTRKREDISILIKTLMREYNKDLGLIPEIMFPTKNGIVVDQFGEDEEIEEEMSENEEYNSPPVGSESEIDSSASVPEEDSVKLENSPIKPSCESASDKNDIFEQTVSNLELLKPDLSELQMPRSRSNKDTLSYLKAKRIIRHKSLESPNKKLKSSD